jgi:phage N-6-adenine-methyltransferase
VAGFRVNRPEHGKKRFRPGGTEDGRVSLVGFKARNHPQQPRKDSVDDRWTPLNLWIPWNDRFGFTLDVAASDENYLCPRYFTLEHDGLAQSWKGERVWCNPPFSDMTSWVRKAWDETRTGRCDLVVMLAPANRTEQPWWQVSIEPYRDKGGALTTEFLPRRINFGSRDNLGAWSASSAPFGCCLLIFDRRPREGEAVSPSRRAEKSDA